MAQMTREKTWRNFFERSNAKIPDFPRMKFTPLAKAKVYIMQPHQISSSDRPQKSRPRNIENVVSLLLEIFHNKTKWQNGKTPKWVLHTSHKRRKVLCSLCFDHFMVSLLWSITVKTIQHCRRCPFYSNNEIDYTFPCEKWLRQTDQHKPWINSGDQLQLSSEVQNGFILDFDQLQRLQTTNLDY